MEEGIKKDEKSKVVKFPNLIKGKSVLKGSVCQKSDEPIDTKKAVYLTPDETWQGRATIINESLINMTEALLVVKEEVLEKETLTLNLEESLLLLQTLHLFLTRSIFALNIRKKNLVDAMMQNEQGETFEHFLTLKTEIKEGDFCTRLLNNITSDQ